MIYEFVFFPFDLVLSLVAVLIVPGGFKGGFLFIGPRFLPLWAELAVPSPVLFEKRGVRAGDLTGPPSSRLGSVGREGRDLR